MGFAGLAASTWSVPVLAQTAVAAPSLALGQAAPDFTLRSADGVNRRLAEQVGRVVLVNFWATWCGPCKLELPHLHALHVRHQHTGLVVWGLSVDQQPEAATAMAKRLGLGFPILLDTDKAVAARYALDSMPGTVLVDRSGRARHLHRGYRDGMETTYEQQVRSLLRE